MPQNPLPEKLAAQAQFIVNNLLQTDYQHEDNINLAEGVLDCDCSEFVGFVLDGLAPDQYGLIPHESGQPRPRAFEYHRFFAALAAASSAGWSMINSLKDARRGDIIAWEFPDLQPAEDTGHVFFVSATPGVDDSGIFWVRVCDSAAQAHFDDTRGDGPEQFPNGVGSGFIKFQVDASGAPIAFLFAPSDNPDPQFTSLLIALGRAEPL
jgi:hypothetical protein